MTKLHAVVDDLGPTLVLPVSFERLIGDRGYDTDELRDWIEELGAEAVIPSKRNRKAPIPHDRAAYWERHRVEDLFCRIKML